MDDPNGPLFVPDDMTEAQREMVRELRERTKALWELRDVYLDCGLDVEAEGLVPTFRRDEFIARRIFLLSSPSIVPSAQLRRNLAFPIELAGALFGRWRQRQQEVPNTTPPRCLDHTVTQHLLSNHTAANYTGHHEKVSCFRPTALSSSIQRVRQRLCWYCNRYSYSRRV